jgi:AmmeMemoRadiSam system protein B
MERSNLRKPVAAGQFYPGSRLQLNSLLDELIDKKAQKVDAIACILPHAGYIYSGSVAGSTVSQVQIKKTILLLGPNHTGYGAEFSLMTEGAWLTPLGEVPIEKTLAENLLSHSAHLKADRMAHLYEHSLEVEVPFLQYIRPDISIVPISLMGDSLSSLKAIGEEIASSIESLKLTHDTLIVASSDMTHYEPQEQAQRKDSLAIKAIEELNEDKLAEVIAKFHITMCGYAPVITALCAAKRLGASSAKLIRYQTSGDTTGDTSSVVGYAGMIIT